MGQGGDTTGATKRTHTRLPRRRTNKTHCANAQTCQIHADRATELLTSYRVMVWLGNLPVRVPSCVVSASAAHGETGLRVLLQFDPANEGRLFGSSEANTCRIPRRSITTSQSNRPARRRSMTVLYDNKYVIIVEPANQHS